MAHSVPGTEWQVAVSCLKLPLPSPQMLYPPNNQGCNADILK